ncbi:hypothetical protein L0F63_000438, partial [Massospora cicadina]
MAIPSSFKPRADSSQAKPYTLPGNHSNPSDRTNSMVITGLSQNCFVSEYLEDLRHVVSSFGPIQSWTPLRSLGQILVVFDEKGIEFGNSVKAARAHLNSLGLHGNERLKAYALEALAYFPSCFAPSGWEASEEGPPNATTFSQDLLHALNTLKLSKEGDASPQYQTLSEPQ